MYDGVHECLWVSPGAVGPQLPETSAERFARLFADSGKVFVIGLRVWELAVDAPYDLTTEVAAVQEAATQQGWSRYHLFGFSAGATVALATARSHPESVRTVSVYEPASIGDDDWSREETRWRRDLGKVRQLPTAQRQPAFRRLLMAPSSELPPDLPTSPPWDEHTDKLENMLAAVRFNSADLVDVTAPALVMSGAQSNGRFTALTDRLVEVMPQAESVSWEGCSHLAPPHRVAPRQLSDLLTHLWRRG